MNIGQTKYGWLNLHRWKHWLLLLAAVVLLLPTVSQARTYCGKLWNTVFEINSHYLVFAPEYKGVDIWAGEGAQNLTKGCDDSFKSIAFYLQWPSMEPSKSYDIFPYNRLPDRFEVGFSSSGSMKGVERDNRYMLFIKLSQATGSTHEWTQAEIDEAAVFDEALGLHAIRGIRRDELETRDVYWLERGDGFVEGVISCSRLRLKPVASSCGYTRDLPQYDAVMIVRFSIANLSQWKDMEQKSIDLLESFIKQ